MYRRTITPFVTLILLVLSAVNLYGHCHTSDGCEDVHNDMISGDRWDTNHRNTVRYYVNDNFLPILPSLHPDVTNASDEWSNIWFDAESVRVNFELDYIGSTPRSPTQVDAWNVVGWGHLPWDESINEGVPAAVYLIRSRDRPREIVEADMVVNYYVPFAPHSSADYDQFCLANILTHEFGHFIYLMDVHPYYDQCNAYEDYTMFNEAGMGVHYQEDLACEDEYGAWYTYNEMRWTAPAPQAQMVQDADAVNETQLLQNYPDPFNPETWIPYELAEDADVSIDIYNSSGGLVRNIVIGQQAPGIYVEASKAAYWDGKDNNGTVVASGVYFYTLRADDFSQTKRLVILK